jgi:hypothetical protein
LNELPIPLAHSLCHHDVSGQVRSAEHVSGARPEHHHNFPAATVEQHVCEHLNKGTALEGEKRLRAAA